MYCTEIAKLLEKCINVLKDVRTHGVVAGGGKCETEICDHLKKKSEETRDPIFAKITSIYANSLLIIPSTLEKNGIIMTNSVGKDVENDVDNSEQCTTKVLDSAFVKITALSLATATVKTIIQSYLPRSDDIIDDSAIKPIKKRKLLYSPKKNRTTLLTKPLGLPRKFRKKPVSDINATRSPQITRTKAVGLHHLRSAIQPLPWPPTLSPPSTPSPSSSQIVSAANVSNGKKSILDQNRNNNKILKRLLFFPFSLPHIFFRPRKSRMSSMFGFAFKQICVETTHWSKTSKRGKKCGNSTHTTKITKGTVPRMWGNFF